MSYPSFFGYMHSEGEGHLPGTHEGDNSPKCGGGINRTFTSSRGSYPIIVLECMIWGALVGSARINTALNVSNWPHA
jgi:hypothetical protein